MPQMSEGPRRAEQKLDSTLSKGLLILETLAQAGRARGVSDLARELSLTKSNTFRLLQTLVALGYVAQPEAGGYQATRKAWRVGRGMVDPLNLRALSAPEMTYLAQETQETIYLAVPEGVTIIYIDKIESRKPIRSWNPIAGQAPMHCCGTGKAVLAANYEMLRPRLVLPLQRYTERTLVELADLDAEMGRTLRRGYAFDSGEYRERILSFGAAIHAPGGGAVGAIGISLPDVNLPEGGIERFGGLLVHAASGISARLGQA